MENEVKKTGNPYAVAIVVICVGIIITGFLFLHALQKMVDAS